MLTNWAGNHAYVAAKLPRARLDRASSRRSSGASRSCACSVRVTRSTTSPTRRAISSRCARHAARLRAGPRRPGPSRSTAASATASSAGRSMPRGSPCTTSPRSRTSRSRAPARPRRTARATASGNLATAVTAMEIVTADGEVAVARPASAIRTSSMAPSSASAGSGVVTSLTLELQPTFQMRQDLYEDLAARPRPSSTSTRSPRCADSVSLFTEWRGPVFDQVWLKRRVARWRRLRTARRLLRRDPRDRPDPPDPADAAGRVHGAARGRRPVARADAALPDGPHAEPAGAELQTEYLIPRQHAADALLAARRDPRPVRGPAPDLRGPDDRGRSSCG